MIIVILIITFSVVDEEIKGEFYFQNKIVGLFFRLYNNFVISIFRSCY
jgi:hypothetical protein